VNKSQVLQSLLDSEIKQVRLLQVSRACRTSRRSGLLTAQFALVLLVCAVLPGRAQYVAYDLGTLGGTWSYAFDINNTGVIVGTSTLGGDREGHAFKFSNGVMSDLGALGGYGTVAHAVNSEGTIVGRTDSTGFGTLRAFSYKDGNVIDLGAGDAYGINAGGTIVGLGVRHAFSYTGGILTDLGTLGGAFSGAYAINDSGTIVGESETALGHDHAFSYTQGIMTDLGTLVGGTFSRATSINNTGTIVGTSTLGGDREGHAFKFSNGVMSDLGTLGGTSSIARDINSAGTIVGSSSTLTGVSHAFRYDGMAMTDLAPFLASVGFLGASYATAINDNGDIVGYADIAGGQHAFLLVSVPEPSALALVSLSLVAMLLQQRKRIQRRLRQ
jgi:probable HAF family extracellular repeat protein